MKKLKFQSLSSFSQNIQLVRSAQLTPWLIFNNNHE